MPKTEKKPPTMEELRQKCEEKGIPYWNKTRAQILLDLAEETGEDSDIFVIDRMAGMTREELLDLKRDNKAIPGKTIAYKKDRPIIEEYLAYNPWAFNNRDLTDETARVRHIFGTKDVVCDCGERFRIERKYYVKKGDMRFPGTETETDIRYCPNCGKKWIYHDMETAKAATGKREGF